MFSHSASAVFLTDTCSHLEEGISSEDLPRSECPVGKSAGAFSYVLIDKGEPTLPTIGGKPTLPIIGGASPGQEGLCCVRKQASMYQSGGTVFRASCIHPLP